jgi:hypothetical protein
MSDAILDLGHRTQRDSDNGVNRETMSSQPGASDMGSRIPDSDQRKSEQDSARPTSSRTSRNTRPSSRATRLAGVTRIRSITQERGDVDLPGVHAQRPEEHQYPSD